MGVFRVFFGCRGVVGFNGCCLGARSGGGFMLACVSVCSGGGGCIAAASLRAVREQVRPARSVVGVSAKKFAQRTKNASKSAFYGVLGELFRG